MTYMYHESPFFFLPHLYEPFYVLARSTNCSDTYLKEFLIRFNRLSPVTAQQSFVGTHLSLYSHSGSHAADTQYSTTPALSSLTPGPPKILQRPLRKLVNVQGKGKEKTYIASSPVKSEVAIATQAPSRYNQVIMYDNRSGELLSVARLGRKVGAIGFDPLNGNLVVATASGQSQLLCYNFEEVDQSWVLSWKYPLHGYGSYVQSVVVSDFCVLLKLDEIPRDTQITSRFLLFSLKTGNVHSIACDGTNFFPRCIDIMLYKDQAGLLAYSNPHDHEEIILLHTDCMVRELTPNTNDGPSSLKAAFQCESGASPAPGSSRSATSGNWGTTDDWMASFAIPRLAVMSSTTKRLEPGSDSMIVTTYSNTYVWLTWRRANHRLTHHAFHSKGETQSTLCDFKLHYFEPTSTPLSRKEQERCHSSGFSAKYASEINALQETQVIELTNVPECTAISGASLGSDSILSLLLVDSTSKRSSNASNKKWVNNNNNGNKQRFVAIAYTL